MSWKIQKSFYEDIFFFYGDTIEQVRKTIAGTDKSWARERYRSLKFMSIVKFIMTEGEKVSAWRPAELSSCRCCITYCCCCHRRRRLLTAYLRQVARIPGARESGRDHGNSL